MGALRTGLLALGRALALVLPLALPLAGAQAARAEPVDRWAPHVAEASARFGIPVEWIRRVIRAESGGRTHLAGRPIVSHAGAMGLMQLMPGTWRDMRARFGLGPDPHDPRDNILAGTAYLRLMYDRFGYPGLFAAYNAGPVRYARHLETGRALPAETVAYMRAVAGPPERAAVESLRTAPPALFALGAGSAARRAPAGAAEADSGDADSAPNLQRGLKRAGPRPSVSDLFVPLHVEGPR